MGLFDIFRKKEEKQPEDVVAPVQETLATDSNGTPSDSEATTNDEPAVKITNGIKIPISKPVTEANNEVSEEPGEQVNPVTVEELAPETSVEEVGPTTVEELAPETLVEEIGRASCRERV